MEILRRLELMIDITDEASAVPVHLKDFGKRVEVLRDRAPARRQPYEVAFLRLMVFEGKNTASCIDATPRR